MANLSGTQGSLILEPSLLVCEAQGAYAVATDEQILAAAQNVIDRKYQKGASFSEPSSVKEYLVTKLANYEHEVFSVLFLDNQHRLIEYAEMFRGTIDGAAVYPREVVKEALKHNSASVIFSHNHPSGLAEPSSADRRMTDRLKEALELVGVRCLDHIVVAGQSTVSFAERGLI